MQERENRKHRFQSIAELKRHYSEYLSAEEMEIILLKRARSVNHLNGESVEEAHLDFIDSCAEAMEYASELKSIGL